MIQEKDFLYRVPVKNVLVTTPRQQIRNPEILVDLEGGEFMHGNILDANSTNKLINQSVKYAVDNNLIGSGYVTKDLLEAETTRATEQENSLKTLIDAETSARTKSDEALGAKIQAEQTRAEGKEKEISDKLAIVDGDSNTEGSFRKAIADVIAAAPEDLDTLKEIADKLAGNDDLHTALNQAITEKADASALANEVTRATAAEATLQNNFDQFVSKTATKESLGVVKVGDGLNVTDGTISVDSTAIGAGNYIPYARYEHDEYIMLNNIRVEGNGTANALNSSIGRNGLSVYKMLNSSIHSNIQCAEIELQSDENRVRINDDGISIWKLDVHAVGGTSDYLLGLSKRGIRLYNGDDNHVLTSNASTIDITQYAKKNELPTVPTKTSQLTNDSNFIAAANFDISPTSITLGDSSNPNVKISSEGIKFAGKTTKDIPTANGTFVNSDDFASADDAYSLRAGLSKKQDKITVNSVDITDIETADITKLRTIVINLIDALSTSGLIREDTNIE